MAAVDNEKWAMEDDLGGGQPQGNGQQQGNGQPQGGGQPQGNGQPVSGEAALKAARDLLKQAANEQVDPGKRHTIMYGFLAFLTLTLIVKDYMVLEQGIEEGKNNSGQVMMISLSSMNFVFFIMVGALGATNVEVNHLWIQRIFGVTATMYILLWCLQSSWTKDGVKWGKNMTSLGQANFYMTLLFTLPYIPFIYRAIVGANRTSLGRKFGVFGIVLLISIILVITISRLNA
jgi:hypothetical protein